MPVFKGKKANANNFAYWDILVKIDDLHIFISIDDCFLLRFKGISTVRLLSRCRLTASDMVGKLAKSLG